MFVPNSPLKMFPDLLKPGVRLVFCGTAASTASAKPKVHQIGLTPTRLSPDEYVALLKYGIGLTDLAKREFGSDRSLPSGCFDAAQLRLQWQKSCK